MNGRAMYVRHVKARIVSWLNSGPCPVVVPSTAGPVIIAVYVNGRYAEPETLEVPDGVPRDWGPDGPFNMKPPPEEGNGEQNGEEDDV